MEKRRKPVLKPADIELEELGIYQKLLKTAYETSDEQLPYHVEGIRGYGNIMPKEIFDKLVKKLLEYNSEINDGLEISFVDYIKKIQVLDPDNNFLKSWEMQGLIKRSYLEEFKQNSFNLILLLFESVMRMITTTSMTDADLTKTG